MKFESFALSDKGLVRAANEDFYLARNEDGLFLVADGMGGLSRGGLASRIAVNAAEYFIRKSRKDDITWPITIEPRYSMEENRLLAAFSLANWSVYNEFLKGGQKTAMGTTLVGLLTDGERVVVANVGDSRAYLIRANAIRQITQDHSLVMEEVRRGAMTAAQARSHPQKHVINRALGLSEIVKSDVYSMETRKGDLFLLCSDGLSDMLEDEDILRLADSHADKSLGELGQALIQGAISRGGRDNVTVVLVRYP